MCYMVDKSVTSDTIIARAYSQDTQVSASLVIICPWAPITDKGNT